MPLRKITVLSAVALSALMLAGCSGTGSPDATASPDATGDSQCAFDVPSGEESDAVTVTGEAPSFSVELPDGFAPTEMQRSVVSEGDGPELHSGDFVSGAYTIIDATTGEPLAVSSDLSPEDSGLVPMLLDPQSFSVFAAALECLPLGSETVLSIPGSMFGDGGQSIVVVAQSVEELPTQATGTEQEPVDGMPAVEFDDTGAPTVTVPQADPPTEVQLENLRTGDGPVVESGDTVYVQYTGVKWSDGSVFDSSWERGTPSGFRTTGVVAGFQQALEGQTVGSQVVVVIPPAFGYGDAEGNELQNETLVFVVDILGTERAPQA